MEQIMKKTALILCCAALLSCNESKKTEIKKPQIEVQITGELSHEILNKKIECNKTSYEYSIPNFNSNTDADLVLNHEITSLITQDFIDVTYAKGTPLKSLFETFTSRRERILCDDKKIEGFTQLETLFVTDNTEFTSYEIEYSKVNSKGRLLKTYLKPELKEIYLNDLIPEEKRRDVKIIFDANLQQAVANLALELPEGEVQNRFTEQVLNKVYQFDTADFQNTGLSLDFKSDVSKKIRVSKIVELPKEFDFLNNTIVIEINAFELSHYLDLSRVMD
ncbi:MAG: hypothetical protein ABJD23_09390 [Nonlabens sp.]